MKLLLFCAAICCALPIAVAADIAAPGSRTYNPPRDWSPKRLVVENAPAAREAELWLPQEFNPNATRTGGALSTPETVLSGGALSLGLALGGLWLARSRRSANTRGVTAAAAVLFVIAGTSVYALANAAPPRPLDPGTLRLASPDGKPLDGTVRIRYSDENGVIRLVLPAPRPQTSKHGE